MVKALDLGIEFRDVSFAIHYPPPSVPPMFLVSHGIAISHVAVYEVGEFLGEVEFTYLYLHK